MKQIKIPAIVVIISVTVFYLEINSIFSVGNVVNYFFVCEQDPLNSFPCYGIYDIGFMLLLIGVIISSLLTIGRRLYLVKKNRNIV